MTAFWHAVMLCRWVLVNYLAAVKKQSITKARLAVLAAAHAWQAPSAYPHPQWLVAGLTGRA